MYIQTFVPVNYSQSIHNQHYFIEVEFQIFGECTCHYTYIQIFMPYKFTIFIPSQKLSPKHVCMWHTCMYMYVHVPAILHPIFSCLVNSQLTSRHRNRVPNNKIMWHTYACIYLPLYVYTSIFFVL